MASHFVLSILNLALNTFSCRIKQKLFEQPLITFTYDFIPPNTTMTDPLIGLEDDKKKKTELIKRVFAEKAASSGVDILKRIVHACDEGGQIEATTLSGGYTNYSYKLFVPGQSDPGTNNL